MTSISHIYIPTFEKERTFEKGMLWDSKYEVEVNPENLDKYLEQFGDAVDQEIYKEKFIR